MANAEGETNSINWVFFTHEMDGPKLAWFTSQLTARAIPYRTQGTGIKGKPILEVEFDSYMDAVAVINQTIPTQLDGLLTLRWADLPDDHEVFVQVAGAGVNPTYEDVHLPKVPGTIRMFDCDSSNVSALGKGEGKGDSIGIFVRFKGGTYYRYGPCTDSTWNLLYAEVVGKAKGSLDASVGSAANRLLRANADAGKITCYKLDGDSWVKVVPKTKKVKK